jgi:hypothetical protein
MYIEALYNCAQDIYTYGSIAYLVAAVLFVGLLLQSYYSNINQAFISIVDIPGQCSTIPIKITNSYLGGTLVLKLQLELHVAFGFRH